MTAKGAGKRQQDRCGTFTYKAMMPCLIALTIFLEALWFWRYYIRKNLQWTLQAWMMIAVMVLFNTPTWAATLRCAWSDPGFARAAKDGEDACKKCGAVKSKFTHHCSKCGRCIDQMDHHCFILDNCVGRNTLRFFA